MTPAEQQLLFPPRSQSRSGRKSLVIEAGAGTGKTTRIIREILEVLLDDPDLRPERIALLTFTDKAAAEIADRIRFALTDLRASFATSRPSWPSDAANPIIVVPPEKREAWLAACDAHLRHIDRFRSQTIHAFCQMLLRAWPMEAGLNPEFTVVAGAEASRLLDRAWREWIAQETREGGDAEVLRQWEIALEHLERLDTIRDVILTMHTKRDLIVDESYELGDIAEADADLRETIANIRERPASEATGLTDPLAIELIQYLRTATPPATADLDAWIDYFAPVSDALEELNKTPLKSFKVLMNPFIDMDGKKIHAVLSGHRAAVALRSMARRFIIRVDELKQRESVVDYDDLLLRTLRLVKDSRVLAELCNMFDVIFVDEFQDTDRVQAQIIDALSRDAAGDLIDGRTMIVGDPKQGIYSFRRADPETYDMTVRRLVADGARLEKLDRQFRSDPALVDDLNAMFSALFATAGTTSVARPVYGADLVAEVAPGGSDLPRITFLREALNADPPETDEPSSVREARLIADWIARAAIDGEYRRFAVLYRKRTNFPACIEALERKGIPYALPPAQAFLDRRPAVDLMSVLRAVAAPFERSAVVSAARSPYFALTDDEIVRDYLFKDQENSAMPGVISEIRRYAELAHHMTVHDLIDTIAAEREIESFYAATDPGLLGDLDRMRDTALDYDLRLGGSLAEFVTEILRRRDESDEADRPDLDETKNAVRIMTVHGAKGLEFDTVILPELVAKTGGSSTRVFAVEEPRSLLFTGRITPIAAMWRTADGTRLLNVPKQREKAEIDRLFYVAVTRAKNQVVFVCDKFTRLNFMPALEAIFDLEPKELSATWREGIESEIVELQTSNGRIVRAAFEQRKPETADSEARRRFVNPAWEEIARATEPGDVAPQNPASVVRMDTGEAMARRAAAANRKSGTLLHRVLEVWDGQAALAPLIERLTVEQAATDDQAARVKQRSALLASSPAFQRIMRAETIGREVPIFYIDTDGVAVEGRIDRIIRENGVSAVVDYKSGSSTSTRRDDDEQQVRAYCEAWSRITGEPCRGMLWYVEDDVVVEV